MVVICNVEDDGCRLGIPSRTILLVVLTNGTVVPIPVTAPMRADALLVSCTVERVARTFLTIQFVTPIPAIGVTVTATVSVHTAMVGTTETRAWAIHFVGAVRTLWTTIALGAFPDTFLVGLAEERAGTANLISTVLRAIFVKVTLVAQWYTRSGCRTVKACGGAGFTIALVAVVTTVPS